MRIVLSNSSLRWGGVHKVTEVLASGLQSRGHDVVIFGRPGGMLQERMQGVAPFEPVLKGMDFHPLAIWGAAVALRKFRADIVLTLMKKDLMLTAFAAAALRIPVVVRHANQQPIGRGLFWKGLYRNLADLHITNAEATKRTLLESADWLSGEEITVIYNGIDAGAYASAPQLDLGLPMNAVVAGYAGSFESRKGVRELARAWHEVSRAIPTAHLVLAGKGKLESEMRAIFGSAPRVHWLGYRKDIASVLRSIDLMVLPSHVEGAPNIVLEAMSAGTPIVATAVSGTPELVRDGIEARLVPPRDPAVLAAAIIEVLSNAGLRGRMSAAARARVDSAFGLRAMIDAYETTLEQVLERASKGKEQ